MEAPPPQVDVCRECKTVLMPPEATKKYRTIKCSQCREVTAVGPPPEDKKYVICSCNALLIIPDDASIFTCTRCKKTRSTVQLISTASGAGMVRSGNSTKSMQSTQSMKTSQSIQSSPSMQSSPSLKSSVGQHVLRSYSVGTLRNTFFRTVSQSSLQMEEVPAGIEALSGTVTPKSFSGGTPDFTINLEGADEVDTVRIKLNEDQQFLIRFFASRVRPSIIKYIDGDKFWFMRLKFTLKLQDIAMSVLFLTTTIDHNFSKQFGFDDLETWLALVLFVPYIGCFIVEWAINKILVYGYVLLLLWCSIFACVNPMKLNFFWNIYDLGHLMEEPMFRCFYLRIPRLQVPLYRMFNPPANSQIESEFFFLSDVHLMSLVFKHPKVSFFFKFWLGFSLVAKTYGRVGVIIALILLPPHPFTIIYAAETFVSFVWMVFWWLVTNKF